MSDTAAIAMDKGALVQEFVMEHVQDAPAWHIGGYGIPLPSFMSQHGLMAVIAALILVFLFVVAYRKSGAAPRGLTNLLEPVILFVRDEIVYPYFGREEGRKLTPLFLSIFFMILTMNLMGLFPVFATATGNFSATMAMASVVFFFMTVVAIFKNGPSGFFHAFVPSGVPLPILLLLVPLEMIGVIIKGGVLGLRLFANMLAGHIALFSILGLILTFGAAGIPAVLLGLFVFFLELLVCFLQAYIFTMLSAMFVSQIHHPEH
ncbi:MAG: F0F1 ATP synthase subunit A [Kiritimatiellia bacterium]